tara:strand:- start:2631 stop:2894 length:264 start_codon:yes stop_codon:yes gene_type:complete
MIELGDYVAQMHPCETMSLKKGVVVGSCKESFTIQWLSYNKDFWMEFEGEQFKELNDRYLLTKMSYHRTNYNVDIAVLSKAGENGVG